MDATVKMKDSTCNMPCVATFSQTTASSISHICNSDSFSIIPPPHHDLISANSIELNAATSLSDDSGIPLTTNSSISSGDSFRMGMCKFEIEMVESDGEVSQFDSLDNFSEGGMSAENFNTLKKGPLAPIDPPPEFQDSPQTTLVRSLSKNVMNSLRRWTSSQSSFEHLKDHASDIVGSCGVSFSCNMKCPEDLCYTDDDKTLKESYAISKHLYSSDSILTNHSDNIYDEPNNIISISLANSADVMDSDLSPVPPPPPPVSIVKIKQTLCPFYQDHTRYFKAIPSEQDNITAAIEKFNLSGLSDIHDYDLYNAAKRNTYHAHESNMQRKVLYSPINHAHHCHINHIYHTTVNSCGNRPNSRNSLNSRLSSSHNSLSVSSANKPDDSIFITQAMSHDALLTCEISDFYNVPIDSDIYAFPVDMIHTEKDCQNQRYDISKASGKEIVKELSQSKEIGIGIKCHQENTSRRNNRNKRKKHASSINSCSGIDNSNEKSKLSMNTSRSKYRVPMASNCLSDIDQQHIDIRTTREPLHMSLNEVKQFYNTLYSSSKSGESLNHASSCKTNTTKSSNETIWSISSTRSRSNLSTTKEINAINRKVTLNAKNSQKLISGVDKIYNNNNVNSMSNHNNQTAQATNLEQKQTQSNFNAKQNIHTEKKSQFTLNLKQKFCSIFRFRRNHARCRTSNNEVDYNYTTREQNSAVPANDDKRKKFQSRALPPLPNKAETTVDCSEKACDKKNEPGPLQFTSSIEKVKDYGWYWGPLSSEAAEKVLSTEPDGSFIVRDSSDDHYIFSLSFKLNNCVRHVRIEQDQGTFSFGSYAKFKSQTITEFIEKAVEHSRSGRYLFFLHRRPEHGPMRVQLTNPVSRFRHIQSLQHMCRFVILKAVIRRDLIQTLPLPRRLLDYLNYKHCYSEQIESDGSHSQISGEESI